MRQTFKRSVSFLLALVMVIGVFASMPFTMFAAGVDYNHNASASSDDYYNIITKTDWDNAPGITESEIVLDNDAGDYRQVVHIMKADVNNSYVNVIPTYNEMNTSKYQTATMLDQANWIDQNMDGEVIGVMNCCLSWYTGYAAERVGEPLGFMMINGEIMFDPGNCGYNYGNVGFPTCVVINKDFDANGNPRPSDIPKVEMPQIRSSADLDGWEDTVIPISSGYIVKDGVNQNKSAHKSQNEPRSVVGITADGQVVIMEVDGRQSPFSAGMNMYECAEVMIAAGCVWAANCDGGGSSTFVSQRPGEELKVNNSPSDGALRPSTSGICFISTAPADGQFYRAHISADSEYYTPNSKIKFNAVGTDMTGNEAEIPADAYWQLSDTSYGTISDGMFVSNGKEGKVTVQLVYNDEIVGEATITIVLPDISFRNETIVIGYGDSMVLPIEVTTNEGRNTVAYSDGDIVYTLSNNSLGTIIGDTFTACDADLGLTDGTITATICGQTSKAVTANIRFGKASEIVYDYEDGMLPVDTSNTGNIGGDDAAESEEYIYGWHISDSRKNGYFGYRWGSSGKNTPIGADIPSKVYLVDKSNGIVRNGNYAMGVDIDWTNVTASCHGQMQIHVPKSIDLTEATSVGFWMYIPAELVTASMQIRAGFLKTDGASAAVTANITDMMGANSGVKNGGWFYFSWEVLDTYKSFEYFEINSHYTAGAGNYNYYQNVTFYVDDFTVDYSDATIDRENPYFTNMLITDENGNGVEISGQTITNNTVNLMAQAYENIVKTNATGLNRASVKVYVDGVLTNANVSVALNGTVNVSNLYLNDGVHTIVMEISDNQGNVGNIVRKLVVNSEKSAVRLEVPAASGLLPTGSIYWISLIADNLANINSVTTTINLDYVNAWELEGMEVAYGFKAEYYINAHNDAVITFTRTGTEIADTDVLAKLPVRIWMAKGWMDDSGIRKNYISDDPKMQDKYYILAPHAMWYSDGTRDYRLVVSAEAGLVTYTDGTTMTFSANETVIQTEMNRYYTNSDRQNKWSFHICTPGEAQNKAPTCTESGYENRVFCVGCACGSVENLGTECDTHDGCGSVIDWGTVVPATGHSYEIEDGKLVCGCGSIYVGKGLVNVNGKYYFFAGNSISSGWITIGDDWYYFDTTTYTATENYNNGYVTYKFDESGKLISGEWYHTSKGSRYYYGPDFYAGSNVGDRCYIIDGKEYYFDINGYCLKGYSYIRGYETDYQWYDFGEDGALKGKWDYTGLYEHKGYTYSLKDGVTIYGFSYVDGAYYYAGSANYRAVVKNIERDTPITNGLLPYGVYRFGADGKMLDNTVYNVNGILYYFVMGKVSEGNGTFEYDGNSYTVEADGKVLYTGLITDASGRTLYYENGIEKEWVKNGLIKDDDGEIRYYVDGVATYAGLVQDADGNYYYINSALKAVKNTGYTIGAAKTNGLLAAGRYEFGADGMMIVDNEEPETPDVPETPDTPETPAVKNGLIKDDDGEIRYYVDGVATYAGLVQDADGNYYYINSVLKAVKNTGYTIGAAKTNGLLAAGRYEFGADGMMIIDNEEPETPDVPETPAVKNGLVKDEDGEVRYYVNGVATYAGLVQDADGNYYYINSTLKAVKNTGYTIGAAKTNGLLAAGRYQFDADGKMILD